LNEPAEYECLLDIHEVIGFEGQHLTYSQEAVTCPPKTRAPDLLAKELPKFCRICPYYLKFKARLDLASKLELLEAKWRMPPVRDAENGKSTRPALSSFSEIAWKSSHSKYWSREHE
jgi:hypothetical protein